MHSYSSLVTGLRTHHNDRTGVYPGVSVAASTLQVYYDELTFRYNLHAMRLDVVLEHYF